VGETADLVSVTIEGKGGSVRVFIRAGEASQLANATGCIVRVEHVYRPAQATPSAPRPQGSTVEGSIPGRVLQRMSASPARSFRAADFHDLGLDVKRIHSALFRLAKSKKIQRVGSGLFRVRREGAAKASAVATTNNGAPTGATSQANVMAFMRKHPATPMRAMEVTRGMGLTGDLRPAIASSLKRLASKGDVTRAGGQFTLSEEGVPQ
jgi:hypothetical protein